METYSALITRRDALTAAPQVFLSFDPPGWRFPVFLPEQEIYHTDAQAANRMVQEQFGVSVVTLQSLRLPEPTLGSPLNIYIMEMRYDHAGDRNDVTDGQSFSVNGRWFDPESLREIEFALPKEGAVLRGWLAEAHRESLLSLRLPWWQEGWFEATAELLQTRVAALGRTPLAPVEQVRNTYTSSLLRVSTSEGYVYLKAVPAPFTLPEITLTRMLSQRDPAHYPLVMAASEDYLLLQDMGRHEPLRDTVPLERWEEIVRFYGQLQASSVHSASRWFSMGCADLRTQSLIERMDDLLGQIPQRLKGLKQQLSTEELTRLQALSAALKTLCTELSDYGIPDALEHGDLHAGNVAVRENDFVLYDWSHACVTCPFYGFGSLTLDDDWFPGQPEALPRLRDAYLETWTGYASLPRLQSAFTLWSRLRPLFLAAHQSNIVAAYQAMMEDDAYIAETATGNALQHMQWFLASHWRNVIASLEEPAK